VSSTREDLPERMKPHAVMRNLNEPVRVLSGPFRFVGETGGTLDSDLVFRWTPSPALVFDDPYSKGTVNLDASSQWVIGGDDPNFEVPVLLTSGSQGSEGPRVQGIIKLEERP
jgi:hypothetical protein